jgi:hypothetical protein
MRPHADGVRVTTAFFMSKHACIAPEACFGAVSDKDKPAMLDALRALSVHLRGPEVAPCLAF